MKHDRKAKTKKVAKRAAKKTTQRLFKEHAVASVLYDSNHQSARFAHLSRTGDHVAPSPLAAQPGFRLNSAVGFREYIVGSTSVSSGTYLYDKCYLFLGLPNVCPTSNGASSQLGQLYYSTAAANSGMDSALSSGVYMPADFSTIGSQGTTEPGIGACMFGGGTMGLALLGEPGELTARVWSGWMPAVTNLGAGTSLTPKSVIETGYQVAEHYAYDVLRLAIEPTYEGLTTTASYNENIWGEGGAEGHDTDAAFKSLGNVPFVLIQTLFKTGAIQPKIQVSVRTNSYYKQGSSALSTYGPETTGPFSDPV